MYGLIFFKVPKMNLEVSKRKNSINLSGCDIIHLFNYSKLMFAIDVRIFLNQFFNKSALFISDFIQCYY